MGKRIEWIDVSKGIGIILVLIGHISLNGGLNKFIYSFHMPLFFILSGFTFKLAKKENFIKNKINTILIPYFSFSLLSYIYWFLIERKIRSQEVSLMHAFSNIFIARPGSENYIFNVSLWFLPTIFILQLLMYFFTKTKNYNRYLVKSIMFTLILGYISSNYLEINLPWGGNIVLIVLPLFLFGYLLSIHIDKVESINIINLKSFMIFICILIIISKYLSIDLNNLKVSNYILFIFTSILGFIVVYILSNIIKSELITYLGKNSLTILCIHEPIKRIVIMVASKITNISAQSMRTNYMGIGMLGIILIIIMTISVEIIYKYFYFLLGKRRKD